MCFYHCAKFQHCPYLRSEKQKKNVTLPPWTGQFHDQNSYMFTYYLVLSFDYGSFYSFPTLCKFLCPQLLYIWCFTHFYIFFLLFSCFEVSLLKKFITSVIQELFSSNNFFLAQKSIQFDPETSLYPPTLAFSSATSLKLITEN